MPERQPIIGIVNKFWGRDRGGVEAVVHAEVQALAARGFNVRVLACRPWRTPSRPAPAGVRLRELPAPVVASMPVHVGFERALQELAAECDLLHFHLPFPLAEKPALRLDKRQPWVATLHAEIHGRGALGAWTRREVTRPFLERTDNVLVSAAANARCATLAGLEVRVHVLPFGLDLSRAPACTRAERHRDLPTVLFLGRLVRYKGLDVLLRAAAGLPCRVEIVGDGPERERLRRLARRLNLNAGFAGHLPDGALPARFAAADIFVLPSRTPAETFGVAQVEAMASGLPVVNTWLGTGVSAVSLNGVTGLTVPPDDPAALRVALARLIADRELRLTLGRRASRRAFELYGLDRHAAGLVDAYNGLLSARARSQGAA